MSEQVIKRQFFFAPNTQLPKDFVEQMPSYFTEHGTTIHKARNLIKVFESPTENGPKINVKKYCIPPIINRIFYSVGVRTPKAKTTYLNALELLKRGIQTPAPFAYIIEKDGWLIRFSYFFSEQVEGLQTIRQEKDNKELLKAVAKYTAEMHEKGCLHKDYTPGNILFRKENGKYKFWLVDINRFKFKNGPISAWCSFEALMKPYDSDESLKEFVLEYAKCRGVSEKLYIPILCLRKIRRAYDKTKRVLKKIPGSKLLLGKPLGK